MLTEYRIHNLFPTHYRLRFEWRSKFMGSSPCCPTFPHQISSQHLYVVSGPKFVDHEPRLDRGRTHHEREAVRKSYDQGSVDCTTRQCHQDIRAFEREPSRSGSHSGQRGVGAREFYRPKRRLEQILLGYLVRPIIPLLQLPEGRYTCFSKYLMFISPVILANEWSGTHRPVASHDTIKTCVGASADHERI